MHLLFKWNFGIFSLSPVFVPVVDIPPTLQRPPLNGPHHSHHHFIPSRLRNSPCIFPICCDVGKDPYSIVTDFYSIHFRFH